MSLSLRRIKGEVNKLLFYISFKQQFIKMNFIKNRLRSFSFAFNGVISAFKLERPFKIHLLATTVVSALGFYFGISKMEWCIIVICCGTVITAELLNTAIEKLCDAVTPEINPKIKFVKDASAGAVLIAAITAVIVAAIIFYSYVKEFLEK